MPSKVKNYLIVLLALATVSASLIAWTQSRRLTALEADLLKASAAATAVKPKSAPVAAEFAGKPATAAVTPAEGDPAAPADEAAGQNRQRNNNRPNFAALMANPEFAKAMSIQQRAALDARYADLFKQLKLSPAQLEKFKDLLVERQNARMDVMATAREQGLDPRANRDELNKMTAEAQAEVDAAIKTSLGESVYNQYQTYDATQPQRALVSQVNSILGYSSTPLNETQSAFLVTALSTGTTATAEQAGGPGNWGGGGNRATITDAVIEQAQAVLFPAQVEVLKQVQAEQQAQQKVRELMRANGGGGGATTGGNRQRN